MVVMNVPVLADMDLDVDAFGVFSGDFAAFEVRLWRCSTPTVTAIADLPVGAKLRSSVVGTERHSMLQ